MKKIIKLVFLFTLFTFLFASTNAYSTTIVVKVKDICEPAPNQTCVIGYNNGMTLKLFDYKNKKGVTSVSDPELPDTPFPCPSGYTEFTSFFIPDINSSNTGLGVIDGVLYINESNPTSNFYYWVFTTSTTFTSYDDWENALNK